MPIFLIHGFRWARISIRILIILNNIEDAASEWIMAPDTSKSLLDNFYKKYDFLPQCRPPLSTSQQTVHISSDLSSEEKFAKNLDLPCTLRSNNSQVSLRSPVPNQSTNKTPILINDNKPNQRIRGEQETMSCESTLSLNMETSIHFNDWSPIKLVEQYDPEEQYVCSQPYAYVADYLVKVDLSVALDEQIQKYEKFRAEQCGGQEEKQNVGSSVYESEEENSNIKNKLKTREKDWFERLRDELEKDSDIGWYVVYCGDQEREIPAWVREKVRTEDPTVVTSPKTLWSAGFKALFRGRRSDAEKLS
ncbi:putative developmental regulator protein [Erysiphe neolycopersici]|uniref:Putative developmental regulator protein n=1 Tax=Erysiphe neolycopersici TaxID=212602 RepID=A0A420HA44_9PEZI|nr:putative developmental regulator protein [Erysiphe neolycopersici]